MVMRVMEDGDEGNGGMDGGWLMRVMEDGDEGNGGW